MIAAGRDDRPTAPHDATCAGGGARQVVLHTGTLDCGNVGDLAMLQTAIGRLSALLGPVSVDVVTDNPVALTYHCPTARPLAFEGFSAWTGDRYAIGTLGRRLPRSVEGIIVGASRALRRAAPLAAARLASLRFRIAGNDPASLHAMVDAVRRADLIVACGQGTLADAAPARSMGLLALLECGVSLGTPTALVGQGVGPMNDPGLRARAAEVLRRVDLIAVREPREGPALLHSLGVAPDRIAVTGDDAVEQAYQARGPFPGEALGLNVRIAPIAGTGHHEAHFFSRLAAGLATRYRVPIVPLPISCHAGGTDDRRAIGQVLRAAGVEVADGSRPHSPAGVIEAAGRCRVVVTGAYHAAVFALSQGVPTVCLGSSQYALDKFHGLAELFAPGCRVVIMGTVDAGAQAETAVDHLWTHAHAYRPVLLEAARRQIAAGWQAYRKLASLVNHTGMAGALQGRS
jgi:colanic acid/amylovoran biosynthesis protein